MKKVSILLIGFLTAISIQAQQKTSAVSIIVNGSKNLQMTIDEKSSNLLNMKALVEKTTVSMDNLGIGQHSLLIVRTNQNSDRTERIATTFNLRYEYDMLIKVNRNGSLELIETKNNGTADNQVAMSDPDFNILLTNVRNQRSTARRSSAITNAFNNNKYYFTTSQVMQLLQLVNSESSRIQLAKLSYPNITDRGNFYQLYYILNSQAGRNELEDFVSAYNEDRNTYTAMSDANFNTLYQDINRQWSDNTQMTSLTNAFNNTNNYFSSYQASQLIQLVNAENDRLKIAKLSYRSITDPGNFNQVVNLISSQAGKNELAAYVNNNYNTGGSPNIAMSDANFNILYQDINRQWPENTQMTSLTNAFNNTNNYFSSYQASRLIQFINGENNQLQLAKLSYRSITDPGNFNQVDNLISSQAGKNELTAFVNNYNNGINPGVAMTDANFNILHQDIKNQWNVNNQITSLTNAFNNTNNFFSSYQASQLIQLLSSESNRLQLAKLSYRSITDKGNFYHVANLISNQANKTELTAYVNNYNNGISNDKSMSDTNFNILYQDINRQWPENTQMTSLTNAFNNTNNFFSSYQASQLIQLISGENNMLQLAKLSYRSITDRDNFKQVVNLISSQANKNELTAYINNNYNTGSSPNLAMSDANFTTLIQTIEKQYLPFEQMNSLTEVFNNTSNYFSSAQVKRLIPLVSYENNRLQLAKLSYRSITDRGNFTQLYDLLNSQSSKNELDAYVKAYKN